MSAPALTRTYAQPRQARQENALDRLIVALWESRREGLEWLCWVAIFLPVAWILMMLGD
jgi:hypothetical protein